MLFPEGSTVISLSGTINTSLGMAGNAFLNLAVIDTEYEKT